MLSQAAVTARWCLCSFRRLWVGGDQAPFGSAGGSASTCEAIDAAVELRVGEDGLDELLAFGVERGADIGRKDAAHEGVAPAVPAGSGVGAFTGVRGDQDGDVLGGEFVHLDVVPVAGVGDDNLERISDSSGVQFALAGGDHRL